MSENSTPAKTESQALGRQLDILPLLDDIVTGFLRHWALVLLLVSGVATGCYFYARSQYVPVYQASGTYIITMNYSVNYDSESYNRSALRQVIDSFRYIIANDAMQTLIADDLGLPTVPGTISARSVEETNAFTITATANDPQLAYQMVQSVARNYPQIAKDVVGETTLTLLTTSGIPTWATNSANPKRTARAGALAVLGVMAALFAFQSIIKKTIRKESDFQSYLNVKCLGSVQRVKLKRSRKGSRYVRIDNKRVPYGFKESIRTIRTRVERRHSEDGSKVFMVSSAIAGEGKSTIAANLALSLTSKGGRIILVDMDLRNSSVLSALGLDENKPGLMEVLEGKANLKDVIIKDDQSGLMILPAGHGSMSVRAALSDPNLKNVFSICRKLADYIIVDTPPSSILADASGLVEFVDSGIFVVRQDYAPLDRIIDGLSLLYDAGLSIAGCVLNYTEAGAVSRYGYGGYGYGYGYGKYGRYGKYGKYGKSGQETE